MFRRFSWSGELTESSMKTSTCQATNTMFTWYFNQHHFTRFTVTIIVLLLLFDQYPPPRSVSTSQAATRLSTPTSDSSFT